MNKRVVIITGITGAQGGAVADAFLSHQEFTLVGITRDPNNPKAKNYQSKGIQIRKADFDNLQSLSQAFKGGHIAFLVTNFWEYMDPKKQFKQGKNLVDAAIKCGVTHIIWTTIQDSRDFKDDMKMLGEYKVPHFDEKGMISKYIKQQKGINATHLYTSFFYQNFLNAMKLKKEKDGIRRFTVNMADAILPMVAVKDIGKMALYCAQKNLYGDVGVASQHLTIKQVCEILKSVIGEPVEYNCVSTDVIRGLGYPGCDDLANMFEFKVVHNKEFRNMRDMSIVKKRINPISFKDWCNQNKQKLK